MRTYRKKRYYSRVKICQFCTDKNLKIDYKDVSLLQRYVDNTGKIRARHHTGACAKHQREVAKAIKNSRHIALLPFKGE